MDRWLYQRYRRNLHRPIPPPRARTIEAPYLWAAHIWCWIIIGIQRTKTRRGDGEIRQQTPEEP